MKISSTFRSKHSMFVDSILNVKNKTLKCWWFSLKVHLFKEFLHFGWSHIPFPGVAALLHLPHGTGHETYICHFVETQAVYKNIYKCIMYILLFFFIHLTTFCGVSILIIFVLFILVDQTCYVYSLLSDCIKQTLKDSFFNFWKVSAMRSSQLFHRVE